MNNSLLTKNMRIIGVKEFSGVYNDKPYTNYRVYFELPEDPNSRGTCCDFIKLSKKVADDTVAQYGLSTILDLVGYDLTNRYYNAYQQIAKLEISL